MFSDDMKYHIFKDYEVPFDEKGSTCGTVRLVQWIKGDNEPDINKAKVEIRKSYINGTEEKFGKGYTFSTPEGPSELVIGLINAGFGNTKDIIKAIRCRDDFEDAVVNINENDDDKSSGEMFDIRSLLLGIDDEEETA